jgi:hypothetical protein
LLCGRIMMVESEGKEASLLHTDARTENRRRFEICNAKRSARQAIQVLVICDHMSHDMCWSAPQLRPSAVPAADLRFGGVLGPFRPPRELLSCRRLPKRHQ